jgi:hypothetical protein
MLDTAASNIDGFLWRETYVSSNQLSRPIWYKQTLSPLENYDFSGSISFKN